MPSHWEALLSGPAGRLVPLTVPFAAVSTWLDDPLTRGRARSPGPAVGQSGHYEVETPASRYRAEATVTGRGSGLGQRHRRPRRRAQPGCSMPARLSGTAGRRRSTGEAPSAASDQVLSAELFSIRVISASLESSAALRSV
jgi:hypothetical protein